MFLVLYLTTLWLIQGHEISSMPPFTCFIILTFRSIINFELIFVHGFYEKVHFLKIWIFNFPRTISLKDNPFFIEVLVALSKINGPKMKGFISGLSTLLICTVTFYWILKMGIIKVLQLGYFIHLFKLYVILCVLMHIIINSF